MDAQILKPARLSLSPTSPTASKEWKHWLATLSNYFLACGQNAPPKLATLVNCVSFEIFEYIEDCLTYNEAVDTLRNLFVKTPNEIYARHQLAVCKQKPGESLDEFLQTLHRLAKDCAFRPVTAAQYHEELVRDAFITGITSHSIRQRLLENKTLDLQSAFNQACSLDQAQRNSETYDPIHVAATAEQPDGRTFSQPNSGAEQPDRRTFPQPNSEPNPSNSTGSLAASYGKNCYFCGKASHNRKFCPARYVVCNHCSRVGHYSRVCKSPPAKPVTASLLCTSTGGSPQSLSQAITKVNLNGHVLNALLDSGSSESFISRNVALKLNLVVTPSSKNITMALNTLNTQTCGSCVVNLMMGKEKYQSVTLRVLKDLCCEIILGQDFQRLHKSFQIMFGVLNLI